jgi:glycolate oxidase FAD binding subunit
VPSGTDVRAKMGVAGHATLMRASHEDFAKLGRFHPEPAPLAKISQGLRARFDPKGLLNPGLMGATS